ncbi:MAG: hypothetical protein JXR76_06060 [Deltaproteobacteria bacterium]|nr:hypothetical protein [Deltaproteobacteria bacterium]
MWGSYVGCSDSSTSNVNDTNEDDTVQAVDTVSDSAPTDTGSTPDTGIDTGTANDSATGQDSTDEPTAAQCAKTGDSKTTLVFINKCSDTLNFKGSDIESGELAAGQSVCRDLGSDVETISSKRYWGYIGPDPGGEHHTLAEMTLNTDFYDFDWYNISHVDAHNLPMAIVPLEMPDCKVLACKQELLTNCPAEGRFLMDGRLVSCVSPDRDNPNSPVAQYFEEGCADAYSWSGDDADSMAACAGEDYEIVFCP